MELPAKSIAVLPFDNLSRDPDNAYFAEGIQDEILTRLAKVADIKVISRTSTQHFKSAPENLPQIAKEFGVTNILEGSMQKVKDEVRMMCSSKLHGRTVTIEPVTVRFCQVDLASAFSVVTIQRGEAARGLYSLS